MIITRTIDGNTANYPEGFFDLVEKVLGKELTDKLPTHNIQEGHYPVPTWGKVNAVKGACLSKNSESRPYFAINYTSCLDNGKSGRIHWDYFLPQRDRGDYWCVAQAAHSAVSLFYQYPKPLKDTSEARGLQELLKYKITTIPSEFSIAYLGIRSIDQNGCVFYKGRSRVGLPNMGLSHPNQQQFLSYYASDSKA